MSRPVVPLTPERVKVVFRRINKYLIDGELKMAAATLGLLSGGIKTSLSLEERDWLKIELAILNKLIDETSEKAGHGK